MSTIKFNSDKEAADALVEKIKVLDTEISKVIHGQKKVVNALLTSVFANGHSLLVGVPGLAKTLLVNTVSSALGLGFNRIQFTPDLMPSDIVGSEILDENRNFKFIEGPVFANVILADEINRTPPKTQAALLEAMQEKKVTYGGKTHELPKPFLVLATQNPIEQEGTYPLPEAQLDRFIFNIDVGYPTLEEEIEIVNLTTGGQSATANAVLTADEIIFYQQLVRRVPIAENVVEYAVKLARKTRPLDQDDEFVKKYIDWGAGPRASQYLVIAAKCNALLNGKYAPDIEDVRSVAGYVLRHRIVKNYRAEAEGLTVDSIIKKLL
ncbi:MAG: AAA family ATPase [Luteibaculaceae bacterium]